MNKLSIAIDGPASSGKSTVAKIIAKNHNYIYIDTGAMYRAVTLAAIQDNVAFANETALVELIKNQPIHFEATANGQLVFLNNIDVTEAIRQNEVTNNVSEVAAHKFVRKYLVDLQRSFAQTGGVVMDGRDIGTVVLPNAQVKIFLIASVDERAERRYKENIEKGIKTNLEILKEEIARRDYLDSTRVVSPLKKADDALQVDTTGMTIEEVVLTIEKIIETKM
ncbi:MAG: (d)CMP kinase [Streptococcaceae bacterium]|jgi:cytidylate kinase|nr:(d)CMP kinase [Streptococcaceae bacterium]